MAKGAVFDPSATDSGKLYGKGIRIGFYLQMAAFLIGFIQPRKLQVKTQLGSIILSLSTLILWLNHVHSKDVNEAGLWVSLALTLALVTPGCVSVLLALPNPNGKQSRRARLLGDGHFLSILKAAFVYYVAIIATMYYTFYIIDHKSGTAFPHSSSTPNQLWIIKLRPASAKLVKIVLTMHAILLLGPALFIGIFFKKIGYLALLSSLNWSADRADRWESRRIAHLLRNNVVTYCLGLVTLAYSALLCASAELTLKGQPGLNPEDKLWSPAQLIAIVIGSFSVASAAGGVLQSLMSYD